MKGLFKFMKSKFSIILIFGCVISIYLEYNLIFAAEDTSSTMAKAITVPSKDTAYELGTVNNPLYVLEIVPNKSYAEIGYLISGCEPVDMEKLSISDLATAYKDRGFSVCTQATEKKYEYELTASEITSGNWKELATESGYYQKKTDGTGVIEQSIVEGNYVYTFVGAGKGTYVWVKSDNTAKVPTDHTADIVWTTIKTYSRIKWTFKHNNTFLKQAIGVSDALVSNYKSVVITVDPTDFSNPDNLKLINKADLIYINGKSHDTDGLQKNWLQMNKEGAALTNTATNFLGENDLSWDVVMAIFNRMISSNRPALIMDTTNIYQSTASVNNAHKLCIMLLQMGPANFNRLMINTSKIKTTLVNGKTTGYYVGGSGTQTITQWDANTFPDNTAKTMYGDLLLKNPTMIGNSNITVGEGIYTFNGDHSLMENLTLQSAISEKPQTSGTTDFTRDAFEWYEYYDRYLKSGANVTNARRTTISPAEAIFFLVHQKFLWADKKVLNILEIEPYDSFIYGTTGWESRFRKLFPQFMGSAADIHVTTMTTYEYIGKIEDINSKYDMIIVGLNTGWKDINQYNDINLKGKVYLSIGDMVNKDPKIRYSGNDITKLKLDQLKNFMQSGKPIILASGFYGTDDRATVSTKVDKVTYMYDLADVVKQSGVTVNTEQAQTDYRTAYKNKIFYENKFNRYMLDKGLSSFSCQLEFYNKNSTTSYPTPYTYTMQADGCISTIAYNGSSTLGYKFKILGEAALYEVKLYIDSDGDGKYRGSLDAPSASLSEQITGLYVKDENNKSVSVKKLKPNTWYTVTRKLEEDYQGIIPWKLEVNAVDNTAVRCSEINYTDIKIKTEKVNINVLEITTDYTTNDVGTNLNMATETRFQKYLNSVPEFNVTITYMTNKQFLALYKYCSGNPTPNTYPYLDDYDMLIIGFRDMCSYTNNQYANQNINDFINKGKSVIFSHDVIWDMDAGSDRRYNADLRKLLDQDRYNFTIGNINTANQRLYYNDNTQAIFSNGLRIYPDGISGTDRYWKFYPDNSNKLYTINANAGGNKANNCDRVIKDTYGNTITPTTWPVETTKISIANQGQITEYPFKIASSISVAPTHTQYYQLNLEDDDMVVWYNLSDNLGELNNNNNNTKNYGYYSSREGDARNNYYIYNKGNITYTGLGHKAGMTDDEIKLFINTMISSYRAGYAQPEIVVTNDDVYTSSTNDQYLYIASDADTAEAVTSSEYVTINYMVQDNSVINTKDRQYYVSYYTNIPDPNDSSKTIRVELNKTASINSTDILDTTNTMSSSLCSVGAEGTAVNSEDVFAINVPLLYLQNKNKLIIEMELSSKGTNEAGVVVTTTFVTPVNLVMIDFFNLD